MKKFIFALLLLSASPALGQSGPGPSVFFTNQSAPAYSAATDGLALASAATDVWCIKGSSTKTIYVQGIRISGTASANATVTTLVIKRTTANSGGTSSNVTVVAHDSQDPAGSATVLSYTANPTPGTSAGFLRAQELIFSGSSAPNLALNPVLYPFSTYNGKVPTLRGTNESLCVNLNGQTVSGGSITVDAEWTEQ